MAMPTAPDSAKKPVPRLDAEGTRLTQLKSGRGPVTHRRAVLLFAFAFMAAPVSSVAYAIEAALRALRGDLALLLPTMARRGRRGGLHPGGEPHPRRPGRLDRRRAVLAVGAVRAAAWDPQRRSRNGRGELSLSRPRAGRSRSKGDVDLFLDAWLPATHEQYRKQYSNQLEDLGTWYDNATLNLAVPDCVQGVDSIADLKAHAADFDGKITGIEASAGETGIVQKTAIPKYGLDPAITHWAYSRYQLKDPKDPLGAMGKGEQLHAIGRKSFGTDFPALAKVGKGLKLTDEQLGSPEDLIQQAPKGPGERRRAEVDRPAQGVRGPGVHRPLRFVRPPPRAGGGRTSHRRVRWWKVSFQPPGRRAYTLLTCAEYGSAERVAAML